MSFPYFLQSIAGSQLGRMLAGGSGAGDSARRRLSAGEVQRQLNAIGGSTRVALEPDLLRHVSWDPPSCLISLTWHALQMHQSQRLHHTRHAQECSHAETK
jgi:hypothetical protein